MCITTPSFHHCKLKEGVVHVGAPCHAGFYMCSVCLSPNGNMHTQQPCGPHATFQGNPLLLSGCLTGHITTWSLALLLLAGASAGANMYAQAQAASRRAASGNYSSYDGGDGGSGTDTGSSYDGEEFGGDAGSFNSTKEGARIAKLAAKAARAARQWKTWQELQQRSRRSGLLIAAASVSSGEQQPE